MFHPIFWVLEGVTGVSPGQLGTQHPGSPTTELADTRQLLKYPENRVKHWILLSPDNRCN